MSLIKCPGCDQQFANTHRPQELGPDDNWHAQGCPLQHGAQKEIDRLEAEVAHLKEKNEFLQPSEKERVIAEENRRLISLVVEEQTHDGMTKLEAAETRNAELEAEVARKGQRNVELSVLASAWMDAHDMLKAGKPYKFPSPADVPNLQERNAELVKGLKAIRDQDYRGNRPSSARMAEAALKQNGETK